MSSPSHTCKNMCDLGPGCPSNNGVLAGFSGATARDARPLDDAPLDDAPLDDVKLGSTRTS